MRSGRCRGQLGAPSLTHFPLNKSAAMCNKSATKYNKMQLNATMYTSKCNNHPNMHETTQYLLWCKYNFVSRGIKQRVSSLHIFMQLNMLKSVNARLCNVAMLNVQYSDVQFSFQRCSWFNVSMFNIAMFNVQFSNVQYSNVQYSDVQCSMQQCSTP